jgi:hypothetical protein
MCAVYRVAVNCLFDGFSASNAANEVVVGQIFTPKNNHQRKPVAATGGTALRTTAPMRLSLPFMGHTLDVSISCTDWSISYLKMNKLSRG